MFAGSEVLAGASILLLNCAFTTDRAAMAPSAAPSAFANSLPIKRPDLEFSVLGL